MQFWITCNIIIIYYNNKKNDVLNIIDGIHNIHERQNMQGHMIFLYYYSIS